MTMAKEYALAKLWSELTWPPYWIEASPQQTDIINRAAEAVRTMAVALDQIERSGTHVCNDDLQLPRGTIVRSREAEIARRALAAVHR